MKTNELLNFFGLYTYEQHYEETLKGSNWKTALICILDQLRINGNSNNITERNIAHSILIAFKIAKKGGEDLSEYYTGLMNVICEKYGLEKLE